MDRNRLALRLCADPKSHTAGSVQFITLLTGGSPLKGDLGGMPPKSHSEQILKRIKEVTMAIIIPLILLVLLLPLNMFFP